MSEQLKKIIDNWKGTSYIGEFRISKENLSIFTHKFESVSVDNLTRSETIFLLRKIKNEFPQRYI